MFEQTALTHNRKPLFRQRTAATPVADVALVVLGQELERREAAFQAALETPHRDLDSTIDAHCESVGEIAQEIVATPAKTLAGLMVKAKALAWCLGEESIEDVLEEQGTTDDQLAYSIVRDLLRMAAN